MWMMWKFLPILNVIGVSLSRLRGGGGAWDCVRSDTNPTAATGRLLTAMGAGPTLRALSDHEEVAGDLDHRRLVLVVGDELQQGLAALGVGHATIEVLEEVTESLDCHHLHILEPGGTHFVAQFGGAVKLRVERIRSRILSAEPGGDRRCDTLYNTRRPDQITNRSVAQPGEAADRGSGEHSTRLQDAPGFTERGGAFRGLDEVIERPHEQRHVDGVVVGVEAVGVPEPSGERGARLASGLRLVNVERNRIDQLNVETMGGLGRKAKVCGSASRSPGSRRRSSVVSFGASPEVHTDWYVAATSIDPMVLVRG